MTQAATPSHQPPLERHPLRRFLGYVAPFKTYLAISVSATIAFVILSALDSRTGTDSRFAEINGLSSRHPYLAVLMALFMFSLAGFPPTAGFFGKFYIFSGAVEEGFVGLAIIGVMASFVSVYYYLRVVVYCFFNEPDSAFQPVSLNPMVTVALLITVVGTLGLGLFPSQWVDISRQAFVSFLP